MYLRLQLTTIFSLSSYRLQFIETIDGKSYCWGGRSQKTEVGSQKLEKLKIKTRNQQLEIKNLKPLTHNNHP